MSSVTGQKSRRRMTDFLDKCGTPRVYISQSASQQQSGHVRISNGMQPTWPSFYVSTNSTTEQCYIDMTIKVYDRNNQVTSTYTETVYSANGTSFPIVPSSPTTFSIPSNGKIHFSAMAHKEGHLDSDLFTATIYNSRQKLELNISPASGTLFEGVVGRAYLDCGDTTENVEIRYYLVSSTLQEPDIPIVPTDTTGSVYSQPITMSASDVTYYAITAKAFSTDDSMDDSDPVSARYTVRAPQISAPVISPSAGPYTLPVEVTITDPTNLCTIRYTTDGTDPTANSPVYTGPFIVEHTTTVKAVNQLPYTSNISQIASATYTITIQEGVITDDPDGILSNSANFHGRYIGPFTLTNDTHFEYKKDGDSTWKTAALQDGSIVQTSNGYSFNGVSGILEGETTYLVKAVGVTNSGTSIDGNIVRFNTPNLSECSLYSVSSSSQVEFGKVNLSYLRVCQDDDAVETDIYDARYWGTAGSRYTVFTNQWDFIGAKEYTKSLYVSRDTDSSNHGINFFWHNFSFTNKVSGSWTRKTLNQNKGTGSGMEVCRDLLGWGTSGNGEWGSSGICSTIADNFYPWCTESTDTKYNPYSSTDTDLRITTNEYRRWADWSNAIGRTPQGGWTSDQATRVSINVRAFPGAFMTRGGYYSTYKTKTLTHSELEYLLYNRVTSSGKHFAKGRIDLGSNQYVNGLIIFSDNYLDSMVPVTISISDSGTAQYSTNTITADQWNRYFDSVALFLPAAGYRDGTTVTGSGTTGLYWTGSHQDSSNAWALEFTDTTLTIIPKPRHYGASIRLCGPPNVSDRSGCNIVTREKGLGTTTGSGYYDLNDSCTVTATADAGWTFTGWKEDGTVVSTNSTYTFTVTSSRTLEAWFTEDSYTVTVNKTPSAGGTVNGAGTYYYGDTAMIVATPASGYRFVRWTEGGNQISENPSYAFTVESNRTITAEFSARTTYDISASSNPTGAATITGTGTKTSGSTCSLQATPVTGYTFSKWTENGSQVSTSNPYSFTVNADRNIVAQLNISGYTVSTTVTPSGGGTVTGGGNFTYGQSCTVTATPSTNYSFSNWTVGGSEVSSTNPYTFQVTGNTTVTANFTANSFQVTTSVQPAAGGTATGGGTYNSGATCTLRATANTGYTFTNWTKGGTVVSSNSTYAFTVSSSTAGAYVANFSAITYTITARSSDSSMGTVTGGGSFTYNQSCTLTATANTGYVFRGWQKDGAKSYISTSNPYSFNVTESATYLGVFESSVVVPTVTTSSVSSITSTGATGGGNVTSAGGGTITQRGVCWSTSQNPTISNSHATASGTTGSYTVNITGLSPATTYYVRAYATNSAGTGYGTQVRFTTSAAIPTVTTSNVTNIASTTATGGGNVTNAGGGTVTERGVCWSTSQNPTISGSHASNGSGTGSFTVSITGLNPGTTYYVRAYATSSAGTGYGSQVSFNTSTTTPTVITVGVNNIGTNTAKMSGSLTSTGGATPVDVGICVGTSPNPDITGQHDSHRVTGPMSFDYTPTNLSSGTTYHYRAYASNENGIVYGADMTFTTKVTLNATMTPTSGAGTVTPYGSNTYDVGEQVSLTANQTSVQGNSYVFAGWHEVSGVND